MMFILKNIAKVLIFGVISTFFAIFAPLKAEATIRVVTTISDLASIAKEIGGEKVSVVSLSQGIQDPHFVDPRPSMVIHVRDADLLIMVGMGLDIWINSLVNASRNPRIKFGRQGRLDASVNVEKLDVPPGGKLCPSIHGPHIFCIMYGNPHYWLDPLNAKLIASDIATRLSDISPENAYFFKKNLSNFSKRIDEKLVQWQERLEPFRGEKVITFHNEWRYFAERFGLIVADELEPKPGIPPSPKHLEEVIDLMKREGIRVILQSPFYETRSAQSVAQRTGARVVVAASSVGGTKEARDYFSLIDTAVNKLAEAMQ
jgi:ABC-type Zn uptake system ZnuABC Zn-binding protein ZnuA